MSAKHAPFMMLFRQGNRKKSASTRSGIHRLIENRYAALSQQLVVTDCTVHRHVIMQLHPPSSPAKVQCKVNVDAVFNCNGIINKEFIPADQIVTSTFYEEV
jgi:hypothetical protein